MHQTCTTATTAAVLCTILCIVLHSNMVLAASGVLIWLQPLSVSSGAKLVVKVQNVHNGYNIYDSGNFLEAKDKCKFVTELLKIDYCIGSVKCNQGRNQTNN